MIAGGLSEWADGYAAGAADAAAGCGELLLDPVLAGDEFAAGYRSGFGHTSPAAKCVRSTGESPVGRVTLIRE